MTGKTPTNVIPFPRVDPQRDIQTTPRPRSAPGSRRVPPIQRRSWRTASNSATARLTSPAHVMDESAETFLEMFSPMGSSRPAPRLRLVP
ncbi:MAG: hypothetical protein VX699_10970 [Myxococcota bacterium]|nr:hypothetical protein [Myxococcota bacterium]